MKILLFFILITFGSAPLRSQYLDRPINVGIMPSFVVIQKSEFAPPRFQASMGYVISIIPKIGYTFNGKYNVGLIGQKIYAGGTYADASSVFGLGYFIKYMPSKIFDRKDVFKHIYPFFEWQHIFNEGYYIFDENTSPVKILKNGSFITLACGVGIRFKKGFSLNLGSGVKYESFYKNINMGKEGGTTDDLTLFMYTTFHYNFKL